MYKSNQIKLTALVGILYLGFSSSSFARLGSITSDWNFDPKNKNCQIFFDDKENFMYIGEVGKFNPNSTCGEKIVRAEREPPREEGWAGRVKNVDDLEKEVEQVAAAFEICKKKCTEAEALRKMGDLNR